MRTLEKLGRVRLSAHFYMRDFLYSEIANMHGVPNIPSDPALAVAAGEKLCTQLLDPLFETFGNVRIRSSFRSVEVNDYGNKNKENCASNEANYAGHIWDRRDANGHMGATSCIVIPWFADQYEQGRDWKDLAWWVHDHLPYSAMEFFPKLAAFNLTWHEAPARSIYNWMDPKRKLLGAGAEPNEDAQERRARYADFPPFCGISYPINKHTWTAA